MSPAPGSTGRLAEQGEERPRLTLVLSHDDHLIRVWGDITDIDMPLLCYLLENLAGYEMRLMDGEPQ